MQQVRDQPELPTKYKDELPAPPQARSMPTAPRATRSAEYIALPGRQQPWLGPALSFVLIVLLPFASFACYLFFIASPRYVARISLLRSPGDPDEWTVGTGNSEQRPGVCLVKPREFVGRCKLRRYRGHPVGRFATGFHRDRLFAEFSGH